MSDAEAAVEDAEPFNVLTQTRYGQMLYNRHDLYIGRSLELYGEWSESELTLLKQVLRPGMVVVDAGANIGTHTLALARTVAPGGIVYAFEPQRIVFQTLAANVALNSLTNVVCQQWALGEASGVARLPPLDYGAANNFGGVELGNGPGTVGEIAGETVEVARLDDLALTTCHLIKIDVEGMELAVLRGAATTIVRCQPLLYVEADRAEQHDDVVRWLDDHGYAVYRHPVPLYDPANFRGNPTNVFAGIVSLNLLAIPSSVPQNVDGLERVTAKRRSLLRRRGTLTPRPPLPGKALTPRPARPHAGPREIASSSPAHGTLGIEGPHGRLVGGRGEGGSPGAEEIRATLERAVAHHQAGRLGEATALYEAVLAVQSNESDALHLLGLIRREEQRFGEALALIGRAAAVVPEQPLFHFNLGGVRRQVGLLAEAKASLRQALVLSPESVEAHLELGLTLLDRRDLEAAEATLRAGLALAPEHAPTHFGLANLLLLTGRYREGWQEYAWRWRMPELSTPQPAAQAPRWDGSPLAGRTILLEAEQGHGDTIQFARYVPWVAALGGRVVLRCRKEIQSLLGTLDGVERLIAPGEPLPPLDLVAALPDLPRIFGTTVETIPNTVPYLHADPARVQAWRARLQADQSGPIDADPAGQLRPIRRVGLVWAGSPDHRLNVQRSASLAALAPLGKARDTRFYSLQKGPPGAEALSPPPGLDLVDLGPALADFAETAAVLSIVDLVITVDTSVAHLAGALGRPAWVLPWATHDWRWLLDRDDTPWYPTVRLFRQQRPNEWEPVVARVAEALQDA